MVVGGGAVEQRRYGDTIGKDSRYARADEFLAIVRELWTGEEVNFSGEWFDIEGARLLDPLDVRLDSAESLVITGGSGTVSANGTLYAKNGGALTLTVVTSNDTRCVQVTGAHTARQTSNTAKSSWTFSFTAGMGDGVQRLVEAERPEDSDVGPEPDPWLAELQRVERIAVDAGLVRDFRDRQSAAGPGQTYPVAKLLGTLNSLKREGAHDAHNIRR